MSAIVSKNLFQIDFFRRTLGDFKSCASANFATRPFSTEGLFYPYLPSIKLASPHFTIFNHTSLLNPVFNHKLFQILFQICMGVFQPLS